MIFFIFMTVLIYSCNKQDNQFNKTALYFDSTISHAQEETLIRDSIVIQYYANDSILLLKYSNGNYKRSHFFNINDVFLERRMRTTEVGEFLGIDSILSFSKIDTIFEYKSARRFIPTVQDYSYADCIYKIQHEGNEYMTIKQSVIDTTYKEVFFYDKDYNIYKFVNTWKDNKCVYVKKE